MLCTPSTAATQKKEVFCFSHTFSIPWILVQLFVDLQQLKPPTPKMYRSVSNICARKSVASLNGKRLFTSIVKKLIGRFLWLERKPLCTPNTGQFHPGLSDL